MCFLKVTHPPTNAKIPHLYKEQAMPTTLKTLSEKPLNQTAASLAISQWASTEKKPLLIITADSLLAAQIENELDFFLADEISQGGLKILHFPDWETLLYDRFSPHQDIISERLATLNTLQKETNTITVVPINTLLHRISPRAHLNQFTFLMNEGDTININEFRTKLTECAYHHVSQVMNHGEFAIRGSIIDLFPMGSRLPYRLDLFDANIDSIRTFDPETQRTIEKIKQIRLLPAKECPMTEEGITHFRNAWRLAFDGNPIDCPMYVDVSEGIATQGIEYYLSLFFEKTESLLDYLHNDSQLILIGNLEEKAKQFWATAEHRFQQLSHDRTRPILPPQQCLFDINTLMHA